MEAVDDGAENCPICMSAMGPYVNVEDELALLPCQHRYHNNCISEWIQTATSCPYCRTEFKTINVLHEPQGSIVRSYTVEPKIQEEQFSEDEEDEEAEYSGTFDLGRSGIVAGCQICASHEREDILMLCDSCDDCYHSFCMGHDQLPATGPFVCPNCLSRGLEPSREGSPIIRTAASVRNSSHRSRRTQSRRNQQRREVQYDNWRTAWERVASRAWDRLNAEIVYDYEPEPSLSAEQEEELRSWRVRMERRSHLTSSTAIVEPPPVVHDPQTASLWAAFEQAKNFSSSSGTTSRRSRSRDVPDSSTIAPVVIADDNPRQRQKRPGAKRRHEIDTEPGSARKRSNTATRGRQEDDRASKAGFLSSLLQTIKEPKVEEGPVNIVSGSARPSLHNHRPMSPISPTSPARSPSPIVHSRQASPSTSPAVDERRLPHSSRSPSPPLSKLDISKLVSSQLKPLYKVKITKEEFTDINRTVTRRLFEDNDYSDADISERIGREIESEIARCSMIV